MGPADSKLPFWFTTEQAAADPEAIAEAEKYVGFSLPEALRALLGIQDGGISNYTGYRSGDGFFPLLPVFGVSPKLAVDSIMRAYDVRNEFGVPDGVIPFAGIGHAWLGLDYRVDARSPSVVYRHSEDHDVKTVAASFDHWLQGLVEEEPE